MVMLQKIGQKLNQGLSASNLNSAYHWFNGRNIKCECYTLDQLLPEPQLSESESAYLLIVRDGVNCILNPYQLNSNDMINEQFQLNWDTTALMRGKIVNKRARYNLCYDNIAQSSNVHEGKGTIIPFSRVKSLSLINEKLPEIVNIPSLSLKAEGNRYYDINKCGIGFHGDSERSIVIAARLGYTMPIAFSWYYKHKRIGEMLNINLNHDDMYFMSQKTVGSDWKRSSILTLRHAAGCNKYIK